MGSESLELCGVRKVRESRGRSLGLQFLACCPGRGVRIKEIPKPVIGDCGIMGMGGRAAEVWFELWSEVVLRLKG